MKQDCESAKHETIRVTEGSGVLTPEPNFNQKSRVGMMCRSAKGTGSCPLDEEEAFSSQYHFPHPAATYKIIKHTFLDVATAIAKEVLFC